jgi:hypothetical protein
VQWHSFSRLSTFPLFASFVWGFGLWLFENHGWTLQRSLLLSMEEIYKKGILDDPNKIGGIWEFLFK